MTADLFAHTARLRRAMPSDRDAAELCYRPEQLAHELRAVVSTRRRDAVSTRAVSTSCAECQRRRHAKSRAIGKWRPAQKRKAA
jgi:hypothetical protein